MAQVLHVKTRHSDEPAKTVPYRPEMRLHQYLRDVLAPAFNSKLMHRGYTVADRFSYSPSHDGLGIIFNCKNRMECVGNFIPPGATLERVANCESSTSLHGNAVEKDVTQTCSICLGAEAGLSEFALGGCTHCFHPKCMMDYMRRFPQQHCPVCRADFCVLDRALVGMIKQALRPWT